MNMELYADEKFMALALKQAQKAAKLGEVPVGAVIVFNGSVVSRGYNQKESRKNSVKHAEIIAMEKACGKLDNWRLSGCVLYVTLEPCMMCTGAILESRIVRVVYGADNIRFGFLRKFAESGVVYPGKIEFTGGILKEESARMLKEFFRAERWLSPVESARLEIE